MLGSCQTARVVRFCGRNDVTKNSPTAPEFIVSDDRDFNAEKNNFITAFNKISDGEHAIVVQEHGFFGPMTPTEWGIFMHKHLDHHFQQFGV